MSSLFSQLIRRRRSILFACLLLPRMGLGEWHWFSTESMTTQVELELWSEDLAQAQQAKQAVFGVFAEVNERMSAYNEASELSELNRMADKQAVLVSSSLLDVVKKSLALSRLSQGAFDVTFGSVGFLYDYRAGTQPDDQMISSQLPSIDYRTVLVDDKARTIRYSRPGVRLGLGGIAKGYAVDLAIGELKRIGVQNARVSAGGDMRLLGDRRGRPWIVGIRDPRSPKDSKTEHAVALPLVDTAVSTSGDYERYFIDEQGRRIHHILSPKTGRPVGGIQSVTILGNETLDTDGLSTAVFVLGVENGLSLIDSLTGFDAIIIDANRKMHYSQGLAPPP